MSQSEVFPVTAQTRVRRKPDRAHYERALAYAILDEALYCSVGFVHDGEPCVIPMAFGRLDDRLVLHGASKARIAESLARGARVCVSVTLIDGVVLARSAMHHSINYRSLVLFGEAREVSEPGAKLAALRSVVEHVMPGRWQAVRAPNELELRATRVLEVPIEIASVKCRSGGPLDDAEDLTWPAWAGSIPLALRSGPPIADPLHAPLVPAPEAALAYRPAREEPPGGLSGR